MSEQRVVWKAVFWGLGAWLIHCMAAFVVVVVLVVCVPRHTDLFDVFDSDLPNITVLFIYISEYAVNYWYTLIVPLACDGMLLAGLSFVSPTNPWLARAWSTLALFCAILFLGLAFVAVSLPLETIAVQAPPQPLGQASEASELSSETERDQSAPEDSTR